MPTIKYVDCFAAIDKWAGKDPAAPWTVEKMLADMERCRIHAALVYSNFAKELHPSLGNQHVLDVCREHPRLIPCWVALPHHAEEAAIGSRFVQTMVDSGVKAVKLFPRMHRYLLDEASVGSLLAALQEAEIPVIFDRGEHEVAQQQIEWEAIAPLCSRYPKLNVILHSVRWEATRYLIPLLQQCPNLYVEFSNHQGNRIIELLVEKVGADQLLFGTQMMEKSPGAAKLLIEYGEIDEQQRYQIAGGNLLRLLRLEQIPADYPDDHPSDAILQTVRRRLPIEDMEVIDAHAHIAEKGHSDNVIAVMPQSDAAGVVDRNRRLGVAITCVSSWTGIWSDARRGNEVTYQAMKDFPGQIIGYATIHPNEVQDWATELKHWHETCGLKGLKPYYPRHRIPYNDPRYEPWFSYGHRHRLFALMHFSDNFVVEMEEIAAKYPDLFFLLAHTGMSYETARKHIQLAKKFNNVFCEITYTAVTNGIIEFLVQEIGSEKVIYGSDAAMRDPCPQLGWVAYADITENDKRNILGRNMRKIIDRCR
ncbi:MAG: amidohydrolase family protein [candidate division KSB1 bacterium]|nr:amidohydrolase family protein [candidate division KSB1 bacterium]MDZ7317937.1 amidohydrolase family protein [candidate division KSB1 bacterium]